MFFSVYNFFFIKTALKPKIESALFIGMNTL